MGEWRKYGVITSRDCLAETLIEALNKKLKQKSVGKSFNHNLKTVNKMDLFGKSPRPTFNKEMRSELAKEIGKEVFEWCNGETPLDDCISDCEDIFEYNSNENGYDLAKEFEDKGYSPDPQLVELLDSVASAKSDLIRKAVKKWVIDDKIEQTIEVGTNVIVKYGNKKVEGTITGTYSETAEYQVAIPSVGITIEGSRRAIIKYENAELIIQSV